MRSLRVITAGILIALAGVSVAAQPRLHIGTNFLGSTYGVDSPVVPPDTNGAVGERHIVELLNGHYAAYRKQNGHRVASASMEQFWSDAGVMPRGFVVDPRVVFDAVAQRWYASAFSINFGNGADDLLVAVSKDADPTRGWAGFVVPFAGPVGNFADFPTLGFDREAVFVFSNGAVLVLPKADLLAPTPTIERSTLLASASLLSPGGSKLQPVVDLDNTALPHPLVGTWDVEGSMLRIWRVTGSATAPVLDASEVFVQMTPYEMVSAQGAIQPQSGIGISTSSPFLATGVVQRNGVLWGVQTVGYQGRAALRWFAVDAQSNALVQEGLISDASHDVFMGSIAVNACNEVVIGFNESGADRFVSAYAVAGVTAGGTTTFGEPVLLQAGVARYDQTGGAPTARWGDYSTTVVDPSHPRTFWTFQEWPSAPDVWSTQVTELKLHAGGPACRAD